MCSKFPYLFCLFIYSDLSATENTSFLSNDAFKSNMNFSIVFYVW